MKHLSILGSTGSIGRSTLAIVEQFPDRFTIKALAAGKNVELLAHQIETFRPDVAVVMDEHLAGQLEQRVGHVPETDILYGDEGYQIAATLSATDMVVGAMVGAAGLLPVMAAISAGKDIALANKETLVMAGELVVEAAKRNQCRILPVDSEHSAIFQCLDGNRREDLDTILLTGSGGPFRDLAVEKFEEITVEAALNHPNWAMGPKITVDSATLMNKGLEVIEARWLFDVPISRIQVVIHPQSIVHSMVAFQDGSVMAQMGIPDMTTAIAYALSYPERLPLKQAIPEFGKLGSLDFESPDLEKFPCLALAFDACETGQTLPAVLNAANEVAVAAFLGGRIPYTHIAGIVRRTMDKHETVAKPAFDDIIDADRWARKQAEEYL